MKKANKTWTYLLIISFALIIGNLIAYAVYWHLPTFEKGLVHFLSQLKDKYVILFLCLVPTFILGFVISKIKYFKNHGINFKKGLIISTIFIYTLALIFPVGYLLHNRKIKIKTDNSLVTDLVIYETKEAEFHFLKSDMVEFCDKKLQEYPHLEHLKLFKDYVEASDSNIYIKQEYVFLPDTFNLVENYEEPGKFDTIPILDWSAAINQYIDAVDYATTELLRNKKFRIFDKEKGVFVDYIYYQSVSDPLGNLDLFCYFPDGRRFVARTLRLGL